MNAIGAYFFDGLRMAFFGDGIPVHGSRKIANGLTTLELKIGIPVIFV
jgi:hypothetical protein